MAQPTKAVPNALPFVVIANGPLTKSVPVVHPVQATTAQNQGTRNTPHEERLQRYEAQLQRDATNRDRECNMRMQYFVQVAKGGRDKVTSTESRLSWANNVASQSEQRLPDLQLLHQHRIAQAEDEIQVAPLQAAQALEHKCHMTVQDANTQQAAQTSWSKSETLRPRDTTTPRMLATHGYQATP